MQRMSLSIKKNSFDPFRSKPPELGPRLEPLSVCIANGIKFTVYPPPVIDSDPDCNRIYHRHSNTLRPIYRVDPVEYYAS